jgi:hypothetical protein
MAELPPEEKNRISHRALAAQAALTLLGGMLAGEPPPGGSGKSIR